MAHPHAENMRLYAEDAAETDEPWERWEHQTWVSLNALSEWKPLSDHPEWHTDYWYRRITQSIKVEGWANIYPDGVVGEMHCTEHAAIRHAIPGCIARKHITFEYTPGEGLE